VQVLVAAVVGWDIACNLLVRLAWIECCELKRYVAGPRLQGRVTMVSRCYRGGVSSS
jgi:hypothetical protein